VQARRSAELRNDDALAAKAKSLRNHGMEPKYFHSLVGGNFRLDALQAAFLRVKLARYASFTKGRQANADYYTEALQQLPGVADGTALVLPRASAGHEHIWNQYTLRVLHGRRDALRDHLASRHIGCDIYYPLTLDQQECFATLPESSRSGCRVAHQLAGEVLSIPVYAELTGSQREEVVAAISSFLQA
ncbi:MAG: DegT/DnrJ/EryC1/StrS family aminotransferase, partial [Roseimicrobium sp.]